MYKYIENAIENYNENTSHGLLLKHIPKGSRVLEFGCGTGVFARFITETLDCRVTGVDISEEAVEIAGAHIEKALVANLDQKGWQTQIPGRDYDVIICADLLEHLVSPERFLIQARELLKDDGKLIFSVPNIAHADILANLFLGNFNYTDIGLLDETHIHFFAKNNIAKTLANAGWMLYDLAGTTVPMGFSEQATRLEDSALKQAICNSECNTVYQFVGAAYKKAHAKKIGAVLNNTLPKEELSISKVYFDFGDGFAESNTAIFPIRDSSVEIKVDLPKGVKQIRFDPTDNGIFLSSGITFRAGKEELIPKATFDVDHWGEYLIFSNDPQFHFATEALKGPIFVSFDIAPMSLTDEHLSAIKKELDERNQSIEELINGRDALTQQVSDLTLQKQALNDRYASCQSELTALNDQLVELSGQHAGCQNELAALNNQYAACQNELAALNSQYTNCKDELDASRNTNAILEASIVSYQKLEKEQQEKILSLCEELAANEYAAEELRKQLEKEQSNAKELQKKIEDYELLVQEKQAEILSLLGQRDALTMSLENERRNTQSLSEELTLYKAYYASAIAQRDAHAMRANRLQLMYDTMASSASWKMTKPLRATLDLLKKIFRRIFRR